SLANAQPIPLFISLLPTLTHEPFTVPHDYYSTEYVATIGVDFQIRTLEIDSTRCKLVISDLGGQDSFKYALSSFYRNANGIAICFDIVNLESFRNLNNWLENVQRLCREQTPIFLVGTKSDLKL
ncbi:unnamed protein product, partial [Adineta ricciae]